MNRFFASPLALWLLVPWAAIVLACFVARGREKSVPFSRLWSGATRLARRGRTTLPPWPILAALGSMLLAIAASAGIRASSAGRWYDLTVVLQRDGVSSDRARATRQATAAVLARHLGPDDQFALRLDGKSPRQLTLAELIAGGDGAATVEETSIIIAAGDRPTTLPHIVAAPALRNAWITSATARRGQIRLSVGATAGIDSVSLRLPDGSIKTLSMTNGQAEHVMPWSAGAIEIISPDDIAGDNVAALPALPSVRLVRAGVLPAELGKFADAYTSVRGEGVDPVALAVGPFDGRGPAVEVFDTAGIVGGKKTWQSHAILNDQPIEQIPLGYLPLLDETWSVIAAVDSRPAVAVQSSPRRVRIALSVPEMQRSPHAVSLLAACVDWAAGDAVVRFEIVDPIDGRSPATPLEELDRILAGVPSSPLDAEMPKWMLYLAAMVALLSLVSLGRPSAR